MHIRPVIIAVEGIDGTGKSTQIPRIAEWFKTQGFAVSISCEPTHGKIGMKIRKAPERLPFAVERQYFVDDRREHVETCLKPAVARGEIAITDRYFYSSVAYQGSRLDAFDHTPTTAELEQLQDDIYAQNREIAPEADILIYISLDVDIALERMRTGREALDPFENRQNLERVAAAYERVVKRHPCVIRSHADMPIDDVTSDIIRQLEAIFA